MQATVAGRQTGQENAPKISQERLGSMVFFGLAVAVFAAIVHTAMYPTATVSFTRDVWHHLSVYRELIASPLYAENPHVATSDPSRSYSPWTVGIAVLAKLTSASPQAALGMSAIGTIASILAGIYLFARTYFKSAWAPAALLVAYFGTWIIQVNHTGYQTFATYFYSLSYPFGIVVGVGLLTWWYTLRTLRAEALGRANLAILAALAFFMFPTHQLQGLFAVGAAMSFALFAPGGSVKRRLLIVAALVAGLLLTKFWWYYDPIAYLTQSDVHKGYYNPNPLFYSLEKPLKILATIGLAVFGVLGFYDPNEKRVRAELLAAFAVLFLGFIVLCARENWVSYRVLPLMVFFLQLGLVAFLMDGLRGQGKVLTAANAVRGLVLLGLALTFPTAARIGWADYKTARHFQETGEVSPRPINWSQDLPATARFAETLAPAESNVIAHVDTAFPMEASALNVVAIPRLFVEVEDMLQRQADNRSFFAPGSTNAERCTILARYDVRLIAYRDYWLDDPVEPVLDRFGTRHDHGDMTFIVPNGDTFTGCDAQ